jgi:hypothetical protein
MTTLKQLNEPIPSRDSISRPLAPFSSMVSENDTTRPRRQVSCLYELFIYGIALEQIFLFQRPVSHLLLL